MEQKDWDRLLDSIDLQDDVKYIERGENRHAIIYYYNGQTTLLTATEF